MKVSQKNRSRIYIYSGLLFILFSFYFSIQSLILSEQKNQYLFKNSKFWEVVTPWDKYKNALQNTQVVNGLRLGMLNSIRLKESETENGGLKKIEAVLTPKKDSYTHFMFRKNGNDFYSFLLSSNDNHPTGFYKFEDFKVVKKKTVDFLIKQKEKYHLEINIDQNKFTAFVNKQKIAEFVDSSWSSGFIEIQASHAPIFMLAFSVQILDRAQQKLKVITDQFDLSSSPKLFMFSKNLWFSIFILFIIGTVFPIFILSGTNKSKGFWFSCLFVLVSSIGLFLSRTYFFGSLLAMFVVVIVFAAYLQIEQGGGTQKSTSKSWLQYAATFLLVMLGLAGWFLILDFQSIDFKGDFDPVRVPNEKRIDMGLPIEGESLEFDLEGELKMPASGIVELRLRTKDAQNDPSGYFLILSNDPNWGSQYGYWEKNQFYLREKLDFNIPAGQWLKFAIKVQKSLVKISFVDETFSLPISPKMKSFKWYLASYQDATFVRNFNYVPQNQRRIHFFEIDQKQFLLFLLVFFSILIFGIAYRSVGFNEKYIIWISICALSAIYFVLSYLGYKNHLSFIPSYIGVLGVLLIVTFVTIKLILKKSRFQPVLVYLLIFSFLTGTEFLTHLNFGNIQLETISGGFSEQNRWFFSPFSRKYNSFLNQFRFNKSQHSDSSAPGVTRIMTLGSSSTASGYPPFLAEMLNEKEKKYEVLNAAVSGTVLKRQFEILKHHYFKFKPDIVILSMGRNDTKYLYNIHDENLRKNNNRIKFQSIIIWTQRILRFSNIYKAIVKKYRNQEDEFILIPTVEEAQKSLDLLYAQLTELAVFCKKKNIKLILIPEPEFYVTAYRLDQMQHTRYLNVIRIFQKVAKEQKVPLSSPLREFYNNRHDFIFIDDVHTNDHGKKILANHLVETLNVLKW